MRYQGQRVSGQVTGQGGRFGGYRFAPGTIEVSASAESYGSARSKAKVTAGGTATVKLKLAPVYEVLEGQRVVVIDDSLVRGTTSHKIIAMLRAAGTRGAGGS